MDPSDQVLASELHDITDEVLATLSPRQLEVIRLRFGLGTAGSEHTLEEVGKQFGLTRERIRQIEAEALRKLRHPSRSRKLKAFLERSGITRRLVSCLSCDLPGRNLLTTVGSVSGQV